MGFIQVSICGEPTVTRMNDQGLTNLHGSVIFIFNVDYYCFWVPLKHRQFVSMGKNVCGFHI